MEWWHVLLLALILVGTVINSVLIYLSVSGSAQIIERQQQINKAQQELSDQMADMEEQFVEIKADVRKNSQHFVNFAKGMKQSGLGKRWEDGA